MMFQSISESFLGKRILWAIILGIALVFRVSAQSESEESNSYVLYDYSDSLHDYAEIIAKLNEYSVNEEGEEFLEKEDRLGIAYEDMPYFTVLYKTNGKEEKFYTSDLLYLIKGPNDCFTLIYSSEKSAELAIEYYLSLDSTIYAELDSEVSACETTDLSQDTFHSWGAEKLGFYPYLSYTEKWGSAKATVAVIDSGVCSHSLLDSKILEMGYDYVDADEDPSNDLYGHGTHVAGILADCTRGVPVYLYPIRILNASGKGKMSNVVNAVREACVAGVDVINLSIESQVQSNALDTAILEGIGQGVTVVAAAGNSSSETSGIYPAHLKEKGVIVVGSAEENGESFVRASYSNFGESVDVYTFGTNIISCSRTGGYVSNTGTSMAAPHISALSALLLLIHSDLTPQEVEDRILEASERYGDIRIPNLSHMIPERYGFYLDQIKIRISEPVSLPTRARPFTACEEITYLSSDPSILEICDGIVLAKKKGNAQVTTRCMGFDEACFSVAVLEEDENKISFSLPKVLQELEDEAFLGNPYIESIVIPDGIRKLGTEVFKDCDALRFVTIPESVIEIGGQIVSEAVILCEEGSTAFEYADENGLQYIMG